MVAIFIASRKVRQNFSEVNVRDDEIILFLYNSSLTSKRMRSILLKMISRHADSHFIMSRIASEGKS